MTNGVFVKDHTEDNGLIVDDWGHANALKVVIEFFHIQMFLRSLKYEARHLNALSNEFNQ